MLLYPYINNNQFLSNYFYITILFTVRPLHLKYLFILHLWTFKTPTLALKKYKNVKSILIVLLFLLLFGWRRSERRNVILKFCWSCLVIYPTFS